MTGDETGGDGLSDPPPTTGAHPGGPRHDEEPFVATTPSRRRWRPRFCATPTISTRWVRSASAGRSRSAASTARRCGTPTARCTHSSTTSRAEYGAADDITDVYQLGAVCYELFTGRPPFEGRPAKVMNKVLNHELTPPSEIADVPEQLDDILLRALSTDKDDRYESVLYLRDELDGLRSL